MDNKKSASANLAITALNFFSPIPKYCAASLTVSEYFFHKGTFSIYGHLLFKVNKFFYHVRANMAKGFVEMTYHEFLGNMQLTYGLEKKKTRIAEKKNPVSY